jgi:uncharacterized protein (UPF0333 family)
MIVLVVVGAVGLFLKFKYRHEARMDELDEQRRAHTTENAAAQVAPADQEAAG